MSQHTPQIISNYRAFDIIVEGVLASEMISLDLFDLNYTSLLSNKEFNTWFSHTDLLRFIHQHMRIGELEFHELRFRVSIIGSIGYNIKRLIECPKSLTSGNINEACTNLSNIPIDLQWPHTHWIR
jgi:hypothetical protein